MEEENRRLKRLVGSRLQPSRQPRRQRFRREFKGHFRDECLNEHWLPSLEDARRTIEGWREDYNQVRHSACVTTGGL